MWVSTIQPFCKEKLVFANDDYAVTLVNTPVSINVLKNDAGFLSIIDPATVTTTGLQQPKNGTVTIINSGSIIYTPNTGFTGVGYFSIYCMLNTYTCCMWHRNCICYHWLMSITHRPKHCFRPGILRQKPGCGKE